MKKFATSVLLAAAVLLCVFAAACAKSDAPVVGTYKLVTVTMSNGRDTRVYPQDSELVSENSFVLEIRSDYKWKMTVSLPGVNETEDGKWTENNGAYALEEDKDEVIHLTVNGSELNFQMNEDGWLMNVTLKKV